MKKLIHPLLIVIVFIMSCSKSAEPTEESIKVLLNAKQLIQNNNVYLLNKGETLIEEKGNRSFDVELLNELTEVLSLKAKYGITFDYSQRNDEEGLDEFLGIDNISLTKFGMSFTSAYQRFNNMHDRVICTSCESLETIIQNCSKEKTLMNLLSLDLQLTEMEHELISSFTNQIGSRDFFDFLGEAFILPQVANPTAGKSFQAVITLGTVKISGSTVFSESIVLVNQQIPKNTTLVPFEKGVWLFSFTPQDTGKYQLDFNVDANLASYDSSIIYPFHGQYEVIAK